MVWLSVLTLRGGQVSQIRAVCQSKRNVAQEHLQTAHRRPDAHDQTPRVADDFRSLIECQEPKPPGAGGVQFLRQRRAPLPDSPGRRQAEANQIEQFVDNCKHLALL